MNIKDVLNTVKANRGPIIKKSLIVLGSAAAIAVTVGLLNRDASDEILEITETAPADLDVTE